MARRRRRIGLLGTIALVVLLALVMAYLEHGHLHLPGIGK
jgi:hypothetical protein